MKDEPVERERAKYPQTTKILPSMGSTSNYTNEPTPGTYLSPKARITPTSPAGNLKPNSPVYKYVYGSKDGQGQQQQFN